MNPLPGPMPTAYDRISYPGHPFEETHPDHLATLGSLFGMTPTPLSSCRVLELGCGEGANLIPIAFQWPGEFVGIDLSDQSIRKGNEFIAALGLTNVTLRCCDIMDVSASRMGQFDYIIAHGVYSWVPAPVRARIFDIFQECLTPQGIAFVSYNCYPGCYSRDIARQLMRYHVRGTTDPRERVAQARAILAFAADASATDSIYGFELRNQQDRVKDMDDAVLYHDDLADVASPFFLHEVADAAGQRGLQYLTDAAFAMSQTERLGPQARERLAALPADDVVRRDQYMDFFEGRAFRESLFCRQDVKLVRKVDPARVVGFHLATSATLSEGPDDPASEGVVTFKTESGSTLKTDHRLSRAALQVLGSRWPAAVGFDETVSQALSRLGSAAEPVRANLDEEIAAFAGLVYRAYSFGQLALHAFAPRLTTKIAERPEASRLARVQAQAGQVITNQRHRSVAMRDEAVRRFVILADGTRTIDQLVHDLASDLETGSRSDIAVTREGVLQNLGLLAKLGLLVD